jgi:hypothetical protein
VQTETDDAVRIPTVIDKDTAITHPTDPMMDETNANDLKDIRII